MPSSHAVETVTSAFGGLTVMVPGAVTENPEGARATVASILP